MQYAIRRVGVFSALLYGLLIGLVAWLVPGYLLGRLALAVVVRLLDWINGLQLTINLPLGQSVPLDLADMLRLGALEAQLTSLAAREGALVLAVTLAAVAGGMLLTALVATLGAIVYNLLAGIFGGVHVTLDPLEVAASQPAQPARVAATAATAATARPAAAAHPAPPPIVNASAARPPAVAPAERVEEMQTMVPPPQARAIPKEAAATAAGAAPDVTRIPTAWLVSAERDSERWLLEDDVTTLGSAPDNDIVLPGLHPRHAEIRYEDGRYIVYDRGTGQTWVNDIPVATMHMLKNGFQLRVGQVELITRIA